MKRIKMQLKRVLVTALAVSMIVGTIDMSCLQVNATEMGSEATQGTVENVNYETVHYFTDRKIALPTAENFRTNIENPQYTFTWYRGNDTTVEPMDPESVPKKLGDYTLKVDVVSQTNGMTASLTLPVTVEVADIDAVATVVPKEDGTDFVAWDEVVLAAPSGFAIAHNQSYWEFVGDPDRMLVVDPRGAAARLESENEVIYYLKEIKTGYISKAKTIKVEVQEKNAPALGAIINGKVLPQVNEDEEITYSYFFKTPASINISGYEDYQIVSQNGNYDENEWTKDTGVFEFTEPGAYNIYIRTVEKGEGWESSLGQTTQGFIVYKDSAQRTYKLVYTKTTNVDKLIKVAFNENTVKSVVVGNTKLLAEQYEVRDEGIILKSSYLDGLDAGEYKVVVTYNPYGREYVDIEENEKPSQTEVVLTIEEFDNDEEVITTEETGYKTETAEGIAEVPESLSNIQTLDTVEEIEEQMLVSVQEVNPDITVENTKTQEVTLLVKLAEGEGWQEATEENFPEEGLTLTIAYPEGTSAETHDFVIAHMFTEDTDEHKAGDVEYPKVTETAEGLKFTVTGLSPITIGWAKTEYKTEATEISEVPDSLRSNQNLDTVEEIKEQMIIAVQKVNSDITMQNTETKDYTLLVKLKENDEWQKVTEENFPEGGITLTIPYPGVTSAETHDFVVAHMFTKDMNGYYAGEIECPEVTKTAKGLEFTVMGLSPITIGWVEVNSDVSTGKGEEGNTPSGGGASGSTANTPSGGNASGGSVNKTSKAESEMDDKADNSNVANPPVLTNPATGDNANIALWCLIMLGCAVVGAAVLNRKKKQ